MKSIKNKRIIFFDGVCKLCNSSVQFIIKHDRQQHFVFVILQSDVAKELLLQFQENIIKRDSILLIGNNKIYTESTAVLHIIKHLSGGWKFLQIFWIIPKFIRDYIYRLIAKKRYKWFGKQEKCMLPSPEIQNRFL